MADKAELLKDYEGKRDLYASFATTMGALISRLLHSDGIELHSIGNRCKTIQSFKGKIDRKDGYECLEQITDLAGVRLITHYEDDVGRVAELIESEFSIDVENSIDKRKALDPDRFGYLSLHYVISLSEGRAALKEYQSFSGMKVEVQIRSILQHTWAEIEHDTGYKSTVEVPKHIRRRFSRLAGLLELADQEFIGIREALQAYSQDVASKVESSAVTEVVDTYIDKVSLTKFLELDPFVLDLDLEIIKILGVTSSPVDWDQAEADINRLKLVGVETLAQLKAALLANRGLVLARAKSIVESRPPGKDVPRRSLRKAISVLYLAQVLAVRNYNPDEASTVLKKMGFVGVDDIIASLIEVVSAESG